MRRLVSSDEIEEGKIYNFVYVGATVLYAKNNGKRTVLVVATAPELQYVQLYDPFGYPSTEDLRRGVITVGCPEAVFKETEIYEPDDETQWFKHSMKVASLTEAIERGILTREDVAVYHNKRVRVVAVSNAQGQHIGRYTCFGVEDKTTQPYLQYVYVWWNTWDQMNTDFKRYGVDIRS
jgi:hypothetical protein